jgi:hypothetical protein
MKDIQRTRAGRSGGIRGAHQEVIGSCRGGLLRNKREKEKGARLSYNYMKRFSRVRSSSVNKVPKSVFLG